MKKPSILTACVIAAVALAAVTTLAIRNSATGEEKPTAKGPDKAAVERSRKTAQMLDSIYKNTIVLITDKYVNDEDDFAAGSAAVLLFENISKGGSHHVRLLDATGQPYDEANTAQDAFEREGIRRLLAGDAVYEQIARIEGKDQLRVMTPVPVVMKKCTMCHDHYNDVKEGEPIGAISYTIPIE